MAPPLPNKRYAMIADIGGTNARFAAVDDKGRITRLRILPTAAYAGLTAAARAWLEETDLSGAVDRAAIAVASPVTSDRVKMTNRDWSFSTAGLKRALRLDEIHIVNDFAAIALSVPALTARDVVKIGPGRAAKGLPAAILGPGTGLGVSLLVPNGKRWLPVATEGGHVSLPAADREDAAVIETLRGRFGHVSAERVLSGPGLAHLYTALAEIDGKQTAMPRPAEVMQGAMAGDDALAVAAVERFCAFLGTVAGDLALTAGALGGVYIAGGIVPRLGQKLSQSPFRARFEAKGRFRTYLRRIPTFVVTRDEPAFLGLKNLLKSG